MSRSLSSFTQRFKSISIYRVLLGFYRVFFLPNFMAFPTIIVATAPHFFAFNLFLDFLLIFSSFSSFSLSLSLFGVAPLFGGAPSSCSVTSKNRFFLGVFFPVFFLRLGEFSSFFLPFHLPRFIFLPLRYLVLPSFFPPQVIWLCRVFLFNVSLLVLG